MVDRLPKVESRTVFWTRHDLTGNQDGVIAWKKLQATSGWTPITKVRCDEGMELASSRNGDGSWSDSEPKDVVAHRMDGQP